MTRFRLAADVGVIDDGARVFAAPLPDGPIVVLAGIAATVWRAALDGDLASVTEELHRLAESDPTQIGPGSIEDDAELFTRALLDQGLLITEEGP